MHKKLRFAVDTQKPYYSERATETIAINTNDYDSVTFELNVTQNGVVLDLEGASVKLAIKKPDKTVTYQSGSVVYAEGGYCLFNLATQSYSTPGPHTAEITIQYTTGEIIVSRSFPFIVEKGILTDSVVESTNWYQDINELADLVESATADFEELVTATEKMNLSTTKADEAAADAATATTEANQAAAAATTATTEANQAAAAATTATTEAIKKLDDKKIKEIARNYQEGKIIDIFKKNEWTALVGRATSDTNNVIKGSESILLESTTINEQAFIRSSVSLKSVGAKNVVLNVFIHNEPSELEGISLFLSNDSGFTNMLSYTFKTINFVKGWNRLIVPVDRFEVTGTGSFSNEMIRKQVRIIPAPGFMGKVTFDSILIDTKQRPSVIFTFDDNWKTQYTTAFKEMKKRGLKGTIGVNGINVGAADYMTWTELEELYSYGWDLANHTNEHYNLAQQNYEVQKKDISDGRQALESRGFTRSSNVLFYPYGSYNQLTLQVLDELGISYARTIREQIETAPPINKKLLKIKNLLPVVTAADAKKSVDDAINTGGTVIFLAHRFGVEDQTNMFYDPTKFIELLDYVSLKNNDSSINVLTISEWLGTF